MERARLHRTGRRLYRQHLHHHRSRRHRESSDRASRTAAQSEGADRDDRMPGTGEPRRSGECVGGRCGDRAGRLDDLERAVASGAGERVMVTNLRKEKAPIEMAAVTLDGHTRAFLKLQEGCDQFCTFCIVPFSRGTSRSVDPRRVMAALDDLHARGFKEVVLTGVHLGGYGKDLEPQVDARRVARDDRRAMPARSRAHQLARSRRVDRSHR